MQLFPLHPWYPQLCTATSWAVPSSSSSTSVGAATQFRLVTLPCCGQESGQGQRHLGWCKLPSHFSSAPLPVPTPGRPDPLPLKPLFPQCVAVCGFLGCRWLTKVGVLNPLSQDSQPEILLLMGKGLCWPQCNGNTHQARGAGLRCR